MASLATLEQYMASGMIASEANGTLYSPAQIQAFLDYATSYINNQAHQVLNENDYTEIYVVGNMWASIDPSGWLHIFPKHTPVLELDSVSYRLLPGATFTEIDEDSYSLNDQDEIIMPFSVPFLRGRFAEIELVYSAGFDEDALTTTAGDLVEACILVAAQFASGGYAAINNDGTPSGAVVPNWALGTGGEKRSVVDDIISRYMKTF